MQCSRVLVATSVLFLGACGETVHDDGFFTWTGQRSFGAMSIDHLNASDDAPLLDELHQATDQRSVAMVYAHIPDVTVSLETIARVLSVAHDDGLAFYSFADLAKGGPAKPGLCLSFDDRAIDQWFELRDLLATYGAHVTFFVTEYDQWNDQEKAKLHVLYADGNSVEAHGVHHVNGRTYVEHHGLAAYIADEVQPSIDILTADGFEPVAFAHPYGAHTAEIDAAVLEHIQLVRSIAEVPLPHHDDH